MDIKIFLPYVNQSIETGFEEIRTLDVEPRRRPEFWHQIGNTALPGISSKVRRDGNKSLGTRSRLQGAYSNTPKVLWRRALSYNKMTPLVGVSGCFKPIQTGTTTYCFQDCSTCWNSTREHASDLQKFVVINCFRRWRDFEFFMGEDEEVSLWHRYFVHLGFHVMHQRYGQFRIISH